MKKNNSITIYTGDLTDIKVTEGGVELTEKAEVELRKLLEAQKVINLLLDAFKDGIGDSMRKENVNLIERGNIKVTRGVTGRKYSLDPDHPVEPNFISSVSYYIPNSKAIEKYIEMEGQVPTGVLEAARKEKIDIELIEE
jgi:hypothetical protein